MIHLLVNPPIPSKERQRVLIVFVEQNLLHRIRLIIQIELELIGVLRFMKDIIFEVIPRIGETPLQRCANDLRGRIWIGGIHVQDLDLNPSN